MIVWSHRLGVKDTRFSI